MCLKKRLHSSEKQLDKYLQARRRSVSLPVNVAIALLVTERAGLIIFSSSSKVHGIGESLLVCELAELVAGSLLFELVAFVVDDGGDELAFDDAVVLVVITVNGDGADTGTDAVVVVVDVPILFGII
jgi:hypothetical protein